MLRGGGKDPALRLDEKPDPLITVTEKNAPAAAGAFFLPDHWKQLAKKMPFSAGEKGGKAVFGGVLQSADRLGYYDYSFLKNF